MLLNQFRSKLDMVKGHKASKEHSLKEAQESVEYFAMGLEHTKQATFIIQMISKQTQEQFQYQIADIVTLALNSVFDEEMNFRVGFVLKRDKTECELFVEQDGIKIDPLKDDGGGLADVVSFALRATSWALSPKKTRPLFILDEPFKNINDPSRALHEKIADMVDMISKKLGIQIIIVTLHPEFADIAGKVFEVKKVDGVSVVSVS